MPSRLLSNDKVLVDEPVPVRELIAGLAAGEVPAHTRQLLGVLHASDVEFRPEGPGPFNVQSPATK